MKLHGRVTQGYDAKPYVARITTNAERPQPVRDEEVLLCSEERAQWPDGFRGYLAMHAPICGSGRQAKRVTPVMRLPESLGYLTDGDVVRVSPRTGEVVVLYRRSSDSNVLFLTERCNCRCVFCPQPPRPSSTNSWVDVCLEAIPLISPDTEQLGITGGEPTTVPDGMLAVIRKCGALLPQTSLHLLTNGRMFNYLSLCRALAMAEHPSLLLGVPVYSDLARVHDAIVRANGAFDQTLRGIMNLERFCQRVEIRTVVARQNHERLVSWARFIARNLPFVEHVAVMGMEMTGLARANAEEVWIDPADYQGQLRDAVGELTASHIPVSVYNEQLCVLDPSLHPVACKSISDWKRWYPDECQRCAAREQCGGLFASNRSRHSRRIAPLACLPPQS